MASSRKPPSVEVPAQPALAGKRVAVGLSGGVDSTVLLHLLARRHDLAALRAVHVHHGLSRNADAWARHCRRLCRALGVPLSVRRVTVRKGKQGLEAAAREARYAAFRTLDCDVVALAHNLDDQAETVVLNLLRGSGVRGGSAIPAESPFHDKRLLRPLLDAPREAIEAYARQHGLQWIEDESNADETLTRNFVRRQLGPLIATRFPRWREALARAARHFADRELSANRLLREYLREHGLRAPSEPRLLEMLRQLGSASPRMQIEHDGAALRTYRGQVHLDRSRKQDPLLPRVVKGRRKLALPELGGELRFRPAADGIAQALFEKNRFLVRPRGGGERLQIDARRPRRTLKNLFQEAGVPPWERDRLPLLYCGTELVWVPGLGVDARWRGAGWLPEWTRRDTA